LLGYLTLEKDFTVVALDAMGGDNAPIEIVKGGIDAINAREDIKVILVGEELGF
jgi:glycerol-3-phosphate acyltransferase PlsX